MSPERAADTAAEQCVLRVLSPTTGLF